MKKIILLFLSALVMVSCTKTPQDKAEALIKEYMGKTLNFPNTYEPRSTKLDSIFSPNGPELIDFSRELVENLEKYDKAVREEKQAKSTMSIFSGVYSEYTKVHYDQAKEEYYAAQKKAKRFEKKCKDILVELHKLGKDGIDKFRYMAAEHHFRAQNNAGNTVSTSYYFYFDKELTKVIKVYDESDLVEINMAKRKMEDHTDIVEEWVDELGLKNK